MPNDEQAIVTRYYELVTALIHKNSCVLNQIFAPTAILKCWNGEHYSKYQWIDLIQNEALTYLKFSTIGLPLISQQVATIKSTVTLQGLTGARGMLSQINFIKDDGNWTLTQQVLSKHDSSKKPIDNGLNRNWLNLK
ncbi:MAG TPA: hypothetical protein DCW31_10960 [Lactobacillus sp.]|nr:hypothetical protein [Lactobacillus sp.]